MAQVAISGTPSLSTPVPCSGHRVGSGLLAGEAIAAGNICYIKSDGKAWLSNGTAATAPAQCHGMALVAAAAGESVSLYTDVEVRYGAALTPGTKLFVSATAGTLSDAATTGGTAPVGVVVDATRIRIWTSRY
jgi:hypothetical protein